MGFEPTIPEGIRALQARALGQTMRPLHDERQAPRPKLHASAGPAVACRLRLESCCCSGGEGGIRTLEGDKPYAFSRRAHSARLCDLSTARIIAQRGASGKARSPLNERRLAATTWERRQPTPASCARQSRRLPSASRSLHRPAPCQSEQSQLWQIRVVRGRIPSSSVPTLATPRIDHNPCT